MVELKTILSNEMMSSFATVMNRLHNYSQENLIPQSLQDLLADKNIQNFMVVANHLQGCNQNESINFFTKCMMSHMLSDIREGESWEYINKMTNTRFQQIYLPNIRRAITSATKTAIFEELSIKVQKVEPEELEIIKNNATEDRNKTKSDNQDINTTKSIHSENEFRSVLGGINDAGPTNTSTQNDEQLQLKIEKTQKLSKNTTEDIHFSNKSCVNFEQSNPDCQKDDKNLDEMRKFEKNNTKNGTFSQDLNYSENKTIDSSQANISDPKLQFERKGRRKFFLEKAEKNKKLKSTSQSENKKIHFMDDSLFTAENISCSSIKTSSLNELRNSADFSNSIEIFEEIKSEKGMILFTSVNKKNNQSCSLTTIEKNDEIIRQAEAYMSELFEKDIKLTLFAAKRILQEKKFAQPEDEMAWDKTKKTLLSYATYGDKDFSIHRQDKKRLAYSVESGEIENSASQYFCQAFNDCAKNLKKARKEGILIEKSKVNSGLIIKNLRKGDDGGKILTSENESQKSNASYGCKFFDYLDNNTKKTIPRVARKKNKRLTVAQRWRKQYQQESEIVEKFYRDVVD